MHYIPLYDSTFLFSPQKLWEEFTVNQRLLDFLFNSACSEQPSSIPQPRIIIGAEGSGKTWLLYALKYRLEESASAFEPVFFSGYSNDVLERLHDLLTNPTTTGKRKIILIDDIEFLFDSMSEDGLYKLRGILNKNGAPLLIGSSRTVPAALTDYSSAFFDGFAIHNIPAISLEQAIALADCKSEKQKERAERLLRISGTNIRSIALVRNILNIASSVTTDEQVLFDYLYPQTNLFISALPRLSQQIIKVIGGANKDLALSEIAEIIGIEANRLSPYISKLVTNQILSKNGSGKRNARYGLVDNRLKFIVQYSKSGLFSHIL